ncbi:hypothetical protein [Legionella sp. PC997]|uniref:hypothetical protein n=1 Tax=Legionella sp. PC997 TaxID=2755562 RepID=UPI0015FC93AE|nr:hypothetical protein [Legionella sp. PC997]
MIKSNQLEYDGMIMATVFRVYFFLGVIAPLIILIGFTVAITKRYNCAHAPFDTTPPASIPSIPKPTRGLVTIWFDGAYSSQGSQDVLKLMDANNFVAAISVPTDSICGYSYLSWNQLKSLQNKGWETVSYSVSGHCSYFSYNLEKELLASKKVLLSRGLRAENFVAPCSYNKSSKMMQFSKQFYSSSRFLDEQLNALPLTDKYNLKSYPVSNKTNPAVIKSLIDVASDSNSWLILVFNQIDNNEIPGHINPEKFAQILEIIKHAKIPVVLPAQVLNLKVRSHS